MTVEQTLRNEIEDSKKWIERDQDESTYKRDLKIRIQLINWALDNLHNPNANICKKIESKMDEILIKIKKSNSIFEMDPLDSELRNLNWIFYQVCNDE